MNGLEAVNVQQREQRLVEAVAQRVQRFHHRHAIAKPGQRVARQGGLALAFASAASRANSASLRWVMSRDQAQAIGRHLLFADDGGAQLQPAIRTAAAAGAEFQPERQAGALAIFLQRLAIDLAVFGMDMGHPVGMRQSVVSCTDRPTICGGFRRQGEKPGAEIQVEHALMRRADGGARQAVERRIGDRAGLRHRSAPALPAAWRHRSRAGRAAPRFLPMAITASASRMAPAAAKPPVAAGPVRFSPKPPTAITAAAMRHQGEGDGAGGDDLRRLVTAAAAKEQIGRNGDASPARWRCRSEAWRPAGPYRPGRPGRSGPRRCGGNAFHSAARCRAPG